jgi:hypothetical protein
MSPLYPSLPLRAWLCHSGSVDGVIGAVAGLLVAAVLAMVNSCLGDRAKVAEGVRDQRVKTYPEVWERTAVVSRWPRTNATRAHCEHLHLDLRTWYYSGGGLFLSEEARERYEHLQIVLEGILTQPGDQPLVHYDELMDAASWFRTSLTTDLQTRHSRNPLTVWMERRQQRAEHAVALERQQAIANTAAPVKALRLQLPAAATELPLTPH